MGHKTSDHPVRIGRVYDDPGPDDGLRVLVDRLWPRGVRKEDPRVEEWVRSVAPSTELRRWYAHRPDRFEEFCGRYESELSVGEAAEGFEQLRELARKGPITLLTATKDITLSHLDFLAQRLSVAHQSASPDTPPGQ